MVPLRVISPRRFGDWSATTFMPYPQPRLWRLPTNRARRSTAWWLILSNLNLHFLGSSFARTRLLDRGITNTMRRLLVLGLAALVSLAVVIWAYTSLPRFSVSQRVDLNEIQQYFHRALTSGPLPWLLYPFRLVVKPYLAPDLRAFAWALLPVLGLLLLQYWWVARADVSFEEASS